MIAPETTFLIQRLQKVEHGETIFYADLNAAVGGVDVRQNYRSRLTSAIKIVKRDYGLVFVAIPDVGYQLLKQEEVAVMAESKGLADVQRATERWEGRLNTVEYSQLDEKGKVNYGRSATRCSMVSCATSEKAFAAVSKRIRPMNQFKPTRDDIVAAIEYGVS